MPKVNLDQIAASAAAQITLIAGEIDPLCDILYSSGEVEPWLIRWYDAKQRGFFSVRCNTLAEAVGKAMRREADGPAR